jgi:hypothetical protein
MPHLWIRPAQRAREGFLYQKLLSSKQNSGAHVFPPQSWVWEQAVFFCQIIKKPIVIDPFSWGVGWWLFLAYSQSVTAITAIDLMVE